MDNLVVCASFGSWQSPHADRIRFEPIPIDDSQLTGDGTGNDDAIRPQIAFVCGRRSSCLLRTICSASPCWRAEMSTQLAAAARWSIACLNWTAAVQVPDYFPGEEMRCVVAAHL